MECQLCLFTIVVSFLLIIFVKTKFSTKNLPPGPWKLPVIGSLHHVIGHNLLHRRLCDLATKHGAIMHLQLGQVPVIVISSSQLAEEVMKTQDIMFASRPSTLATSVITYNGRNIFLSPYGPYLVQLKKICALELFSSRRVKSFRSIREDEVSCLIRSLASKTGTPVNLTRTIETLLYCTISRTAFGKALNQTLL